MSFTIGIKLSTTDSDGKEFTSAPAYIRTETATSMLVHTDALVKALMLLENAGVIDSYSVVLKSEPEPAAPGAGP